MWRVSRFRAVLIRRFVAFVLIPFSVGACGLTTGGADASLAVSYDEGYVHAGAQLCAALESGLGDPEIKNALLTEELHLLVDPINGYVLRVATDAGRTADEALQYISGMWDGAALACGERFPNPVDYPAMMDSADVAELLGHTVKQIQIMAREPPPDVSGFLNIARKTPST